MKDFFSFRRMVTPVIIMIIFWVMIAVMVISLAAQSVYLVGLANRTHQQSYYLVLCCIWPIGLPLGFLAVRIYCEILILFFRMNETLTDIKNALQNR
jgi:hypothetical protein